MEKKILGYRLKKSLLSSVNRPEEFLKSVVQLGPLHNAAATENSINESINNEYKQGNKCPINSYKSAGVLDVWFDEVYEEEIELAGYKLQILPQGGSSRRVQFGCTIISTVTIYDLKEILLKKEASAVLYIGGTKVTPELLNRILDKLKEK